MIKYNLTCNNQHSFFGWFDSFSSFKLQLKKNMVSCPYCQDTKVLQSPAAPNVINNSSRSKKNSEQRFFDENVIQQKRNIEKLSKSFLNVGNKFSKVALEMHNNLREKKPIFGTASNSEVDKLIEKGIDVYKLEMQKTQKN